MARKYPKRLATEAEVKKRIKSRNGKPFFDPRFKHRKLFGGASLSYIIPVELCPAWILRLIAKLSTLIKTMTSF